MRLLIAGGGTGGHLYPGIAVAEEVMARPGGEVLFVGTRRGLEARVVPAAGYPLELLEVSGLKRMGALGVVRGLARLPVALLRSLSIVRKFRPDVVLGVGGYASGPVVLAAALAGYPTAVQEQNSVPGFTNRTLGRFTRAVLVAFEEARRFFPAPKVSLVGNPVRRRFVEALGAARAGGAQLLVVGGSQGARAVNDLMIAAAEILARQGTLPAMVHQTGPADAERCAERYKALGLGERVSVRPFIEDMAAALGDAALVVGRAGALTLAELAIVGKPAILIPLPTAADDHQSRNAAAFADAGAAIVVDQRQATAADLAAQIAALMGDAARREAMGRAMSALARPRAAREAVERLEALAQRR
jgi:UDP-N-acetylglucosamine--N-acetylmuramyl-(pentapeptide) pyrophosphoryl-undecaprenol N-acetylglucosamine transferase